jgi:hypothetical protein
LRQEVTAVAKMKRGHKGTGAAPLEREIQAQIERLRELRSSPCYPLLLTATEIGPRLVDDVYDDLRQRYGPECHSLDVLVDSGGGDIDAAYNLAQLFRQFGDDSLTFIVPRWAKSAATLLVCAGDRILMTPVAELGPVDPQITQMNALERRLESFSPLHIESTLALIRDEYKTGNKELADGLMQRLQFPLTLGSFKKTLDLGKQYLVKLLSTRMLKNSDKDAREVARELTEGYPDHGYCINVEEARTVGLEADPLHGEELEVVWEIHRLTQKRREIEQDRKKKELTERIKELPPELIQKLPPLLTQPEQSP